jgi:hypothetical protein
MRLGVPQAEIFQPVAPRRCPRADWFDGVPLINMFADTATVMRVVNMMSFVIAERRAAVASERTRRRSLATD